MTLVERHAELAALQRRFTDAARGRGPAVLVTGPVASGKTELLDTFAEVAVSAGALYLNAACSAVEKDLPFGVVGQLLGSVDACAEITAHLLADGQRFAAGGSDPAATERKTVQALRAVCTTLLELSRSQPVIIGIDDTQNCDALSLRSILYLARRMRSSHLLLVLTMVATPRPALPLLHADMMSQPHCSDLALAPLSPAGVGEVLARHTSDVRAAELADACHAATGGNPLLVQAVAADLRDGELVFGNAFDRAVVNLLYRSPREHRDLARAAAVLGDSAVPVLVSRLARLDGSVAHQAVTALQHAGLLTGARLRHPRARRAILDDIHAVGDTGLHRRAAELLHTDLAPPSEVAGHLLAAQEVDFPWAVSVLTAAAEDALGAGRPAFAAECLKLALQLTTEEAQALQIRVDLSRVEWRIDPTLAMRHIGELTEAIQDGRLTGLGALMTVCWLLWAGRPDLAVACVERVASTAGEGDTRLLAEVRLTKLCAAYLFPAYREALLPGPDLQRPAPADDPAPSVHTSDILYDVLSHGLSAGSTTRVDQMLRRSPLDDLTIPSSAMAIAVLVEADELCQAAACCDRLGRQAAQRHAPTWQAILASARADVALRRGDVRAAMAGVRTAFEHLPPHGWGVAVGMPVATMLRAATLAGDYEEAGRQLDQAVPEAMFDCAYGLPYLHARGNYYLATDRLAEALDDFHTCGKLISAWHIEAANLVPWRADAARVWLRLGHPQTARQVLDEQLEAYGSRRSSAAATVRWMRAMLDDRPDRLAVVTEAVSVLESGGMRLALAEALGALSRLQQEYGDEQAARRTAHRAWAIARECHASELAESLLASTKQHEVVAPAMPVAAGAPELPAASARDEDGPLLSNAELRVATLAERGRTNRQIARELYITVSTVEQHLTQVYRKLGVNRRSHLTGRIPDEARMSHQP
jgi:DNA-binding NarL/FixJ family response regulator